LFAEEKSLKRKRTAPAAVADTSVIAQWRFSYRAAVQWHNIRNITQNKLNFANTITQTQIQKMLL
jgi:hypothetical protein